MYACPICKRTFEKVCALKVHFHQVHRDVENSWALSTACPLCGAPLSPHGFKMHYFWRGLAGSEDHAIAFYMLAGRFVGRFAKVVKRAAVDALRAKRRGARVRLTPNGRP